MSGKRPKADRDVVPPCNLSLTLYFYKRSFLNIHKEADIFLRLPHKVKKRRKIVKTKELVIIVSGFRYLMKDGFQIKASQMHFVYSTDETIQTDTGDVEFILFFQSFHCVCLLNKHGVFSCFFSSVWTSFVAYSSCLGTFIKNAIWSQPLSTKPRNDYIITSTAIIRILFVPFDLGIIFIIFLLFLRVCELFFYVLFSIFLIYSSSLTALIPPGGLNGVADQCTWLLWQHGRLLLLPCKILTRLPNQTIMNGAINSDY